MSYSIHALILTCSIYSSITVVVVFMLAITCMFMHYSNIRSLQVNTMFMQSTE